MLEFDHTYLRVIMTQKLYWYVVIPIVIIYVIWIFSEEGVRCTPSLVN